MYLSVYKINESALKIIDKISASTRSENGISYIFFLNNSGRYIADVFILNANEEILLATKPNIVENLANHIKKFDIRNQFAYEDSCYYLNWSATKTTCADPRGLGYWELSHRFNDEVAEYTKLRMEQEIPEFEDFEHERSIILEYGKAAEFIAHDKGCYLGQELINRVRTQGIVRKTVQRTQKNDENIIKVLIENEDNVLALVRKA